MKLQQLKYVCAIVQNELNVSLTAHTLYTSQPGISKQIRMLEDELGVDIFIRNGKHLTELTPVGAKIVEVAEEVLNKVHKIKQIVNDYKRCDLGSLNFGVNYIEAKYLLPRALNDFNNSFPKVVVRLQQSTPLHLYEMVANRDLDFALSAEMYGDYPELLFIPCYHSNDSFIVHHTHPLAALKKEKPNMTTEEWVEALSEYSFITSFQSEQGRLQLEKFFSEYAYYPNIICNAISEDVVKTYLTMNMGVGVLSSLVINDLGSDFVCLNEKPWFEGEQINLVLRKHAFLRKFAISFIQCLLPTLDSNILNELLNKKNEEL